MRLICAALIGILVAGCGRRQATPPVLPLPILAPAENEEPAGAGADAWRSEGAQAAATNQRTRVLAELQGLDAHDWAGDYCAGDLLGVNLSLTLAPRTGFVYEWHGCLGLYDRNYGAVALEAGRVRLSPTFKDRKLDFVGIASELIPVPWQGRRYLIPVKEVIDFCNCVNNGHEPRTTAHGRFLLRRSDETKNVAGLPDLPPRYRDYLLAEPVDASVLAVGATTTRPSAGELKYRDTPLTLDAGKNKGLKRGMTLVVTSPADWYESLRITEVGDDWAEGMMTQFGEDAPAPQAGWRVSTGPRWAPRRPGNI
jgi:hypothetical protein